MQSPAKKPHTSTILDHSTIDLTDSTHDEDQAPNNGSILLDGSVDMNTSRDMSEVQVDQEKAADSTETEATQLFQDSIPPLHAPVSRQASGIFTIQGVPKVLSQATYDDNAFLAKASSHRAKSSHGSTTLPPTPTSFNLADSLLRKAKDRISPLNSCNNGFMASQSRTNFGQIPLYAQRINKHDSQQNIEGAFIASSQSTQSMSRHASLDKSGFQKLQMSVHYSLIGGGGDDDYPIPAEEDMDGVRGVMEFDPDIVTHDGNTEENRWAQDDVDTGYAMAGGYDDDDFRISSQPPQRSLRNQAFQHQTWNAIEDEDSSTFHGGFHSSSAGYGSSFPLTHVKSLNDSIEEIDSSQEAPPMSMMPIIDDGEDLDREIAVVLRKPTARSISSKYQPNNGPIHLPSPSSTPLTTEALSDPRAKFLSPTSSTSPAPTGSTQTLSSSARPLSSPLSFLPGSAPSVKGLGSALAFKTSKRIVASKPKVSKINNARMMNQAAMEIIEDDIANEQSATRDVSVDSSHEMIEEFPAPETKPSSYSPYEMVAKASSGVSKPVPTSPMRSESKDEGPNSRARIVQSKPTTSTPRPQANIIPKATPEWLSSIAPPIMPPTTAVRSPLVLQPSSRTSPVIIEIALVGESYGGGYTSVVGLLLSEMVTRQPDLFQDMSNSSASQSAPLVHLLLNLSPSLLTPGQIVAPQNFSCFHYSPEVPLQWLHHTKADKSPIALSSIIFAEQTNLLDKEILKLLGDVTLLDRLQTAIPVTRSWSSFSSHLSKGMPLPHPSIPDFGPSTTSNMHHPISVGQSMVPMHMRTGQTGQAIRHYVSPFAFNGSPLGVRNMEITLLACFQLKIGLAAPKQMPMVNNLRLQDFKINAAKAVSLAEASARQKMTILHHRSSEHFSIAKLKHIKAQSTLQKNSSPSNTIIRALALSPSTKSLIWLDMSPSEQVLALQPGHVMRITGTFEGSRSHASPALSSLANDALNFFGLSLLDCSHSINLEGHGRQQKERLSSQAFPSSQDSNPDEEVGHGGQAHRGVPTNGQYGPPNAMVTDDHHILSPSSSSHLPSCSIWRVTLSDPKQFSIVSTRDANDKLLRLRYEASSSPSPSSLLHGPFSGTRRVSILANISTIPNLLVSRNEASFSCIIDVIGSDPSIPFSLSLPAFPFSKMSINGPLLFDMLIQDSSRSFKVDGFTRVTLLSPSQGISASRTNRHLTRSLCTSGIMSRLEVSPNDSLHFKSSSKNEMQLVPISSLIPSSSSFQTSMMPSSDRILELHISCPNLHHRHHQQGDLVVLPMTFKFESFAPHPPPEYNAFCRACSSFVTPVHS
jgi:hypothetical protein